MDDQRGFADLSGDHNPLHVSPETARRLLYGHPVVHGMHLLLWAIDRLVPLLPTGSSVAALQATFDQAVFPGIEVAVTWEVNGEEAHATVSIPGGEAARIHLRIGQFGPCDDVPDRPVEAEKCCEISREAMATASGETPLAFSHRLADALFPNICRLMPACWTASLLAASRIVGMQCPGLHSLFRAIELRRTGDGPPESPGMLRFAVDRWDSRFNLVHMNISTRGLGGRIEGFYRPAPVKQPEIDVVSAHVVRDEFARQHALVIGGSRGLGEVTAKLVAAGGGRVAITYASGRADAERVEQECHCAGLNLRSAHYDVLDRNGVLPVSDRPYTHVYYFAAPRIRPGRRGDTNQTLLREYRSMFVDAWRRTFDKALALCVRPATFFYPSTVFLDTPQRLFREYVLAKAEGEGVCRELADRHPDVRIVTPRLPMMATDQSQSLIATAPQPALGVMLDALRRARTD